MEGAVSIGAVCLVDRTVSGANQVFIHRTDRKKQLVKKRFASPSISSPIELSGLKTAMKLAEFFDASLAAKALNRESLLLTCAIGSQLSGFARTSNAFHRIVNRLGAQR